MTNQEILEISRNNMDLNITNLCAISGKSEEEIKDLLLCEQWTEWEHAQNLEDFDTASL